MTQNGNRRYGHDRRFTSKPAQRSRRAMLAERERSDAVLERLDPNRNHGSGTIDCLVLLRNIIEATFMPRVKEVIDAHRNKESVVPLRARGVTLFGADDFSRVSRRAGLDSGVIGDRLSIVASSMPSTRVMQIGGVMISGVSPDARGLRHVSLGFRDEGRSEILEDRRLVTSAFPEVVMRQRTPHMTVFSTTDQRLAEQVQGDFRELKLAGSELILGEPTLGRTLPTEARPGLLRLS